MPPRLLPPSTAACCRASAGSPVTSLTACLAGLTLQQTRHASILGSLANNKGAKQNKKRVGRGPSSGHGKTSGRGHKGQRQHGKVNPWFQGGQTPLVVKHGTMGFTNLRAPKMAEVNLDKIQDWINQGRLDATKQITPKELIESKLVGSVKDGVKILSRGSECLSQPIDVMVSRVSAGAIAAIEGAGGKVTTRYYTKLAIRRLLTGESVNTDRPLPVGKEHVEGVLEAARKAPFRYRLPDPTSRRDIEYYRDPAHRGYLSHQLAPGESPSLYFKVPGERKIKSAAKAEKKAVEETLCASEAPQQSMSLFGSTPPDHDGGEPTMVSTPRRQNKTRGGGLFDDEPSSQRTSSSNGLFDDDGDRHGGGGGGGDDSSPWDMPTPRRQRSRADMIRNLLSASAVPDAYIETFDAVVREDGSGGRVGSAGVAKLFANARLGPEAQTRIMSLVAPGDGSDVSLGRNEFNVVLALIGLAQEGDIISLDGVDERRTNLPQPKLPGLTAEPVLPPVAELAAKPPQTPTEPLPQPSPPHTQHEQQPSSSSPNAHPGAAETTTTGPSMTQTKAFRPAMDDPEDDPWNSPEVHKGHDHAKTNGGGVHGTVNGHSNSSNNNGFGETPTPTMSRGAVNHYATTPGTSASSNTGRPTSSSVSGQGGWGYFGGATPSGTGGFHDPVQNAVASPFGGGDGAADRAPGNEPPTTTIRNIGGRTGSNVEETVIVTLMPGKEGVFMFQHHNYEVASQRRGSKVIRRYSDFVWLLDCLHKRYPFRVLPLLPPKRVAVNGNHLSNDGAFIEKRRRGLARFLNALVRHPILSQEQLVVMFLTVPTELAVWRKQATISVQDEFNDRALPPGLEDSLPPTLEELFTRTRSGVRRSAELYIAVCNIMDRLVKRTEGVAADHARIAMSLTSLTETSADTYATDTNEVPLLNDGLVAMSKHLRTCQTLLEDESRGWDEGVLEDLKRQRDALVSVRELFERRERLDKDNIPYLERRIQTNETKLANLRSKPEGMVKPGEIEKVAEAIIKDKESIVQQHNRSIFVKECLRDELVTFQTTQYHISRWNQDWAGERVKYAEMLADNWRRLLDELEGMPLGE
ncbi:putative glucose transporter rco-3 [Purpureocillium lavendulum]|uniref:Sorting nexin MVP1 n=1 Tax=Purpureocillium lavendulum TaxID=1247861 RepID=A0AB34FL64_9HYPO|nr:putative glucose transporter rco-3 [Purpureocillium lavendulum]